MVLCRFYMIVEHWIDVLTATVASFFLEWEKKAIEVKLLQINNIGIELGVRYSKVVYLI